MALVVVAGVIVYNTVINVVETPRAPDDFGPSVEQIANSIAVLPFAFIITQAAVINGVVIRVRNQQAGTQVKQNRTAKQIQIMQESESLSRPGVPQ